MRHNTFHFGLLMFLNLELKFEREKGQHNFFACQGN